MKSFTYTITDPVGMHARPASLLAKEIKNYKSGVSITKEGKTIDAGKVMMLMSLGIKCGEEIVVEITGEDEDAAAAAIESFFKANL